MKLIIGLGNPGKEYEKTRHNIGFEILKKLALDIGISEFRAKFQGLIAEGKIKGEKVLLLMPQTFMNLSGNSVAEAVKFYKLDPQKDIIVLYDDMDLPLGKIRLRAKGSAGGHNGIKSIISHIGDQFIRIKCGIGKGNNKEDTVNFVLGKFSKESEAEVNSMIETTIKAVKEITCEDNLDIIASKYN